MSLDVPVIETDRLILRAPRLSDHAASCAYFAEPRSKWNGGPLGPREVEGMITSAAGGWALRGYGLWFVTLKGDETAIGFSGIFHPFDWPEPELGYGIAAEYEGKGIAFEASLAARKAAAGHFDLNGLPSFIAPDNARSQALALRMGAIREAEITLRDRIATVYRHPNTEAF